MRLILRSSIIILLASLFVYAQKAEKPQIELTEDYLSPTKQDTALAAFENLNVFKILPRGMFDYEKNALSLRGGGAYYSFTKKSHSYNETPQIQLENNYLQVGFYGVSYGLIADLGESSPELANLTFEADFLLNYTPPKIKPEIRAEKGKARDYEIKGIKLKSLVPAVVGTTYLLRAISFDEADTLVIFKIHRRDADGSLIVFWKTIKDFETPPLLYQTDQELSKKIRQLLLEKGLNNISFEVNNNVVILRGTVPRAKLTDTIFAVHQLRPKKIENQLMVEK